MQSEQIKGMAGTLLFHGSLSILLAFWKLAEPIQVPEFIEVTWGSSSSVVAAGGTLAGGAPTPASTTLESPNKPVSSLPLKLPERRFGTDKEIISVPQRDKLETSESPGRARVAKSSQPALRRDMPQSLGRKEQYRETGKGAGASDAKGERVGEGPGTSAGSGVSMVVEWSGGGTRRKLTGALPAYPPGETTETQIRIEAVVTPAGRVRAVRPVQKGSARLEEAAMKEVRLWTFEPLKPLVVQKDQTCVITFNFRLR